MTASTLGQDGFRWFIGAVEDRDDPLKLGRLKVRIFNVHTEKRNLIPTKDLPWAVMMNPINSASLRDVGISPTGILVGTVVVGFFMDGNDSNIPVIMGTLVGIGENKQDLHDVPKEAREINSIVKEPQTADDPFRGEPSSAYAAKYPYNKVIKTERGHVIEIDDTPGKERFHIYHRSGTYEEINSDGRKVSKVVDDDFDVVVKNRDVYIGGNLNVRIKGNVDVLVDGTYTVESKDIMTFIAPKIFLNPDKD
jgi:hypothetical protein